MGHELLAEVALGKCAKFDVQVIFNDVPLELPREGDKWIMQLFLEAGFLMEELRRLNRVRIYQQVLFLSCVLGASGKTLDAKYLKKRPEEEQRSKLKFPNKRPPRKDFKLWEKALRQIVPAEGIMDRLGAFKHEGYKIWPWCYDPTSYRLLHRKQTRWMSTKRCLG